MSVEDEVDKELDFHVEMRIRELVSKGLSPEEARAQAIAKFGDLREVRETCREIARGRDRDMRIREWWDEVRGDLLFALRQMRAAPGLTAMVVLLLGVGIGASSAVFSVVNAVMLRPLPFPEPERLVRIYETTPQTDRFSTSEQNFLDFRAQARSFEDLGVCSYQNRKFSLAAGGEPIRFEAVACTASLLRMLKVPPSLGRAFTEEEAQFGGDNRVLVLSEGLWKSRFASDPEVVGRALDLGGQKWTVVGVLPGRFSFLGSWDAWIPYAVDPEFERGDRRLEMFGRLAPGVTLEQARADLSAVAARLGDLYPESNRDWGVALVPFREWILGPQVRQASFVLGLAVGLILLLACLNVSNLLIARATSRSREIGLRAALGASRLRLLRQLLTESVFLSTLGAGTGLLLAYWAIPFIRVINPEALPRLDESSWDGTMILVSVAVSVTAGILSGLAPALHVARPHLSETLREGHRASASRGGRLRDTLVVGEFALAMLLLITAGLLVTSFRRLNAVDPGFDARNVLAARVILPEDRYPEASSESARFYRDVVEKLGAIPGVERAGAVIVDPFRGPRTSNTIAPESVRDKRDFTAVQWRSVTPSYFEVVRIPLLRGSLFEERARADLREREALVSANLAKRLWPGAEPIGKRFQWIRPGGILFRVIGVVGDVQDLALEEEPPLMVYHDQQRFAVQHMTLMVRSRAEPSAIAPLIWKTVAEVDPGVPAGSVFSLEQRLFESVAGPRFSTQLLGSFALLALAMACFGIYGVTSYSVARRTREIGIRMALGARSGSVVALVLRRGLLLVLLGTVAGSLAALGLTRYLRSLLYETSPTDVATFVAMGLMLAAVGFLSTYVPALRATRVDPLEAVRLE
jgi:predicted permease